MRRRTGASIIYAGQQSKDAVRSWLVGKEEKLDRQHRRPQPRAHRQKNGSGIKHTTDIIRRRASPHRPCIRRLSRLQPPSPLSARA